MDQPTETMLKTFTLSWGVLHFIMFDKCEIVFYICKT